MDIIILIFLTISIGKRAMENGLPAGPWRLRLVLTWLAFEFFGGFIGIMLFGYNKENLLGLALFALACAFGGYLLVKRALDKKASEIDKEIDDIGNADQS